MNKNHIQLTEDGQRGVATLDKSEKKPTQPSYFNQKTSSPRSIRYRLTFTLLFHIVLLLVIVSLLTSNYAKAASRKFLRGFIMGAMFAHHYPHL